MKRVYETDSYIRELRTRVTGAATEDKGRYYVELEDTIFFPEEGGQNADTGVLVFEGPGGSETVKVLDGIISGRKTCSSAAGGNADSPLSGEDEIRIRYITDRGIPVGTEVLCKLDWSTRFDRMQNHSGEHILSGIMHRRFGVDNVGFHLSDTGPVTVDFNRPVSYKNVIEAQDEVNSVIYSNMPVKVSFPSKEELKMIDYRSKIDIDGQVRLITIGDDTDPADRCACCAPHVAFTGEIGFLKVLSVVNWKGGIRVSMLCGRRALEYVNREHDILTGLSRSLSTEAVNVQGIVDSYRDEIASLKAELAGAKEKALIDEATRMSPPYILFGDDNLPAPVMKNVYNALTEMFDGFVGVFAGNDDEGYRYNAGSRDLDSRELAVKLKEALGAKGGGSFEMIQGKVTADKEAITRFFLEL